MQRSPFDTTSPAKRRVLEFLQHVKDNNEFRFVVDGNETQAHAFVQHMRVELSRIRKLARQAGHNPRRITMRMRSIAILPSADGPRCTVTLFKDASSEASGISPETFDDFVDLTGGVPAEPQ